MNIYSEVKNQYPHLSDRDVERIIDKAKMFYYGYQFPCEPKLCGCERPLTSFFARTWVLSACDELIERLGFNSAAGYKENGISWTFDGAELSDRLVGLIKPEIGVIK